MAASELPPVASMRPAPTRARSVRASGSGTSIHSGLLDSLDTNTETKGSKWYGTLGKDGISAQMMRHPHVKQSVGYTVNPLTGATWRFKPVSSSARDKEVADFNNYVWLECLPWTMILERMQGGASQDGFALAELTDDMRSVPAERFPNHPRPGAALVPTGLHEIPANTVSYWHKSASNPTQLESIDQWQPYSDNESPGHRNVKADRIVRLTIEQKGANFAGISVLRSAYGAWKVMQAFEMFRAIGFERTAVGTPVATAGENTTKDEMDAIEDVLENMRTMAKGAVVMPNGYTIEWSGAGENDLANLNIAIEACKTDIAVNVTCGWSRLGLVGPGSYALGNTQLGQYHLSTVGRARLISTVFTLGLDGWSPVKRITEANYGVGTPVPILEARNLPTKDIKTTIPLIYTGIAQKAITPDDALEEELRGALDVGPHDPDTARKPQAMPSFGAPPEADDAEEDPEPEDTDDDTAARLCGSGYDRHALHHMGMLVCACGRDAKDHR